MDDKQRVTRGSQIRLEIDRSFESGPMQKASDEFQEGLNRLQEDEDPPSDNGSGSRDEASELAPLVLDEQQLERHVIQALNTAAELSGDALIDVRHALVGTLIVIAHKNRKTEAFDRFGEFFPQAYTDELKRNHKPSTTKRTSILLGRGLADSLKSAFDQLPTESRKLWGRDWIAACLLTAGDRSLLTFAAEAGTTVAGLQDGWFAAVTASSKHRSAEAWAGWWRQAGVPLPDERRVLFGFLGRSLDDHLNVRDDARAMAMLIAHDRTEPPLSIGVLGDWGSGKSFFLELVEHEINSLSEVGTTGICRRVAPIHFNAWHFSDANLWPSLAGHIFEELWQFMTSETTGEEAREEIRGRLREAKGALYAAEAELHLARRALTDAEEEERTLREKLAARKVVKASVIDGLKKLATAIGWQGPLEAIHEIDEAASSLHRAGVRARTVLDVALSRPALLSAIPWILASLAATAALATLAAMSEEVTGVRQALQSVAAIGGVLATMVSAVGAPLAKASSIVGAFSTQLSEAVSEFDSKVEKAAKSEPESDLAKRAKNWRGRVEQIRLKVEAARKRVGTLEEEQIALDPARRLTSFLEERSRSDDYRAKQGIISLVRRDLTELASLMKDWNLSRHQTDSERVPSVPLPEGVTPVDRIVLYIDDLDRCSPQVVVHTLEAVHLMLALELFVVVVAVDSRWLLRALEVHYQDLLSTDVGDDSQYRVSTPQNYLEKIFQVTFALAPMSTGGFGAYVDALTERIYPRSVSTWEETSLEESGDDRNQPTPEGDDEKPASDSGGTDQNGQNGDDSDGAENGEDRDPGRAINQTEIQRTSSDDPTRSLIIKEPEKAFLKSLHELVPTPRLAKRLVNVYRLVKGRAPVAELNAFEDREHGRYRPILLLLAILYGRPQLAVALFKNLSEGTMRDESSNRANPPLFVAMQSHFKHLEAESRPPGAEEWKKLTEVVKRVAPEVTLKACEAEAFPLARFSLATGKVWHTWRPRASEGPE